MLFNNDFTLFCKENKIGKWIYNEKKDKWVLTFEKFEINQINEIHKIYNGEQGGLIIGKLHCEGGIHMIKPNPDGTEFTYAGEMEGWEYISTSAKSVNHVNDLIKINNKVKSKKGCIPTNFDIPENCKVIDLSQNEIQILYLSRFTQVIINRQSTRINIEEIVELEDKNKD